MATSRSRNSDPGQSSSNFASSRTMASRTNSLTNRSGPDSSAIAIDGFHSTLDAPAPPSRRTADEVWREIVSGERTRLCKEEMPDEDLMTLEDFLVKAGASIVDDEEQEEEDVKVPLPSEQLSGVFAFGPLATSGSMVEKLEPLGSFGNGMEAIGAGGIVGVRAKRGPAVLETLDRASQQRQKRMIKNRESAARSRERKQAYQVELESMVAKLEEENDELLKEKAERREGRLKQIMEKVIPVVEKPRTLPPLRKVRSMQW